MLYDIAIYFPLQPEDLFVQTIDNIDVEGPPPDKKLKKSECTPLFMAAYKYAGISEYLSLFEYAVYQYVGVYPTKEK